MTNNVLTSLTIENEYLCGICHNVYDEPYRPNVCNHVFCKTCLINSSANSSSCPCCRRQFKIKDIVFEHKIRNKINSLKFSCESCSKIYKLCDYNTHAQQCNSATTPKAYSSLNHLSSTNNSLASSSLSRHSSISSAGASSIRSVNRYTFKCPYCSESNFTREGLLEHCNEFHVNGPKEVVCPICSCMPWGDPKQKSIDFIVHLNLRHRFEYDNFIDFNVDEDEMMQKAIRNSMNDAFRKMKIPNY